MSSGAKNFLISLLLLYVLLDLGGAYMIEQDHPKILGVYFRSLGHPSFLIYAIFCIAASVVLFLNLN